VEKGANFFFILKKRLEVDQSEGERANTMLMTNQQVRRYGIIVEIVTHLPEVVLQPKRDISLN